MASPPGGIGPRSVANHAGVPQIVNATFRIAAAGEGTVVQHPPHEHGLKIRLHSFLMSPIADGNVTLASSGLSTETSLIGEIEVKADSPVQQDGGLIHGLGTCAYMADLAVSSTAGIAGNVSYSLVP